MNEEVKRKIPAFKEILGPVEGDLDHELDDPDLSEWAKRRDRNAHLLLTAWRTLLEREKKEKEAAKVESQETEAAVAGGPYLPHD